MIYSYALNSIANPVICLLMKQDYKVFFKDMLSKFSKRNESASTVNISETTPAAFRPTLSASTDKSISSIKKPFCKGSCYSIFKFVEGAQILLLFSVKLEINDTIYVIKQVAGEKDQMVRWPLLTDEFTIPNFI